MKPVRTGKPGTEKGAVQAPMHGEGAAVAPMNREGAAVAPMNTEGAEVAPMNKEGADPASDAMSEATTCGTSIHDDLLLHLFHRTRENLPVLPAPNAPERFGAGELPAASTRDLPPSGLGRWATDMPRESLCRLTSPLLSPRGIRPWEFEIPALPPGRRERAKKPTRH